MNAGIRVAVAMLASIAFLAGCQRKIDYERLRAQTDARYDEISIEEYLPSFQAFQNTDPDFAISIPRGFGMRTILNSEKARIYEFAKGGDRIRIDIIDSYSMTHTISVGRKKHSYNDYLSGEMDRAYEDYTKAYFDALAKDEVYAIEKGVRRLGKNVLIYTKYEESEGGSPSFHAHYNFLIDGFTIDLAGMVVSGRESERDVIRSMNSFR